jgi:hypothetical protein
MITNLGNISPIRAITALTVVLIISLATAAQKVARSIDITKVEVETLIGADIRSFSLDGLHLGMTPEDASKILVASKRLLGVTDPVDDTIYVLPKIKTAKKKRPRFIYFGTEIGKCRE